MAALNDLREFACKGIHSLGMRRRVSYLHDVGDWVTHSGMVDRCMIAGYDLHILQPAHALGDRGSGQSHLLAEL
jgi:hypothetical protein